ncbi:MAG TPA: STAS domain-containing protein [Amycolatopsis sp.]|uniref:STAS domain-containing protein n=1 Tax=Amycolatopsis nalaikhensis TaxID=715472 RepID=A0ABY8XFE6_9PSEU|nr:STAS domain-containing protein [Amycolatopsis sp. 2-2]WIV54339.1 STAS domain-containing protein [Amycolatopsis sp. 2-2]
MTTYEQPGEAGVDPSSAHRLPSPRAPSDGLFRSQVRWRSSDAVVVEVSGELDACTAARLEETLCEHVRARPGALRVDLGEVAFLGTAGIQALVRAHLLAEENGVHLVVDPGTSRAATRALSLLDRIGIEPLKLS